jgi:cysteine desulfurase family protein (TIGR01976 family)
MPARKKPSPNSSAPAKRLLNASAVRRRFPALRQVVEGVRPVYFDNPGGTQVPQSVLAAMRRYLVEINCNQHGQFHTARMTDRMLLEARAAMADFLNAPGPNEIVFGANMTTLTFHTSRAIGQTLSRGDQIILTRMDHDANVAPWLLLARDHGLKVKWVDWNPATGLLNMAELERQITARTRLIACVYASNALGTINNVKRITELAHAAGAMVYVDAVQYAPHGPIDVQDIDCDFLACSAYKFFGPHVGVLYGKREHLESLPAYKVRPSPNDIPERWETGTKNHEGIAGTLAAVEYFEWIGERFGKPYEKQVKGYRGRRRTLKLAMHAIQDYEQGLSRRLLEGLGRIKNVSVVGISDPAMLDQRVPTVIFTVKGKTPAQVARELGEKGIYVWDGDYYALEVMERLGRANRGGMVRVGATHYNTVREINRFLREVEVIARDGLKVVGGNGQESTGERRRTKKTSGSMARRKVSAPQPDITA